MESFELAELLAAKFSHDIAGPIGAVSNGIEFLSDSSFEMKDQAAQLLENSAREASARLQFFRFAYGALKATGEANLEQIRDLSKNYFSFGKNTLDWNVKLPPQHSAVFTQRMGKILVNMMIICANSLMQGGTIKPTISSKSGGEGLMFEVTANGKMVKVDPVINMFFAGEANGVEVTTKNIQIYYTSLLAHKSGAVAEISATDTSFQMSLTLG